MAFEDVMADPARELAALAAVLGLSEKVPSSPSKHHESLGSEPRFTSPCSSLASIVCVTDPKS